jgi:L-asparaginase
MVIFTGGTIGSRKTDRSINVDTSTSFELIQMYETHAGKRIVEFDTVQPLNILSENLVPADWTTMIRQLETIDFSLYQGIIITHGTDTLPFTAAALSFACQGFPIPLVLIASNFPINDSRGKGLENFTHAVDFIADQPLSGVFVIFENNRGEAIVHLGTRLMQSDPYTDEYDSTYSVPFGVMDNKKFTYNIHELNPALAKLQNNHAPKLDISAIAFSSEVLYIKPYPGLNYAYYDFSTHKPKAVLHDLYHSGTASTHTTKTFHASILDFMAYCKSHNVAIYITPLKNNSGDLYASSIQFMQAGAIPLENISVESAMVKLMLAYGSFNDTQHILDFMQDNALFFEIHSLG